MRDQFLNEVHEEMYMDPESISFVQFIRRTPQNVVEKYLIHKNKEEELIAERWCWDWNQENENLTLRKNIELVKKGEYSSVLKKDTAFLTEMKIAPLLQRINTLSISPKEFEFENMRILDGPGFDLRIQSYFYQIKASWRIVPEEWAGLNEVVDGIVAVVVEAVEGN